jgi:hypothetical protein
MDQGGEDGLGEGEGVKMGVQRRLLLFRILYL